MVDPGATGAMANPKKRIAQRTHEAPHMNMPVSTKRSQLRNNDTSCHRHLAGIGGAFIPPNHGNLNRIGPLNGRKLTLIDLERDSGLCLVLGTGRKRRETEAHGVVEIP